MKETIINKQNMSSKLEMLKLASENLDSNVLMLEYKAIRHIRGLSRDRSDPLKWIHERHYDILDNIAMKLRRKTSNDNDTAIILEAKLSLELLEPYLTKQELNASGELKCRSCGKVVDIEWMLCPECGQNLKHSCCSQCGRNLEYSWKLCPYCGLNLN